MAVRTFIRGLQRLAPADRKGLRVLCYHLIDGATTAAVDLAHNEFARQISALRQATRLVGLVEGVGLIRGGSDEPCVAVTFDDAFRNFHEVVWPILQEHAVPATLFVPTGFIDGTSPAPLTGVDLPPCSWGQLRELASSDLITIGSHTCTHPDLRRLDSRGLDAELRGSRARLEDELGVSIGSFCYPRGLWNRRVERQVIEVYDLAVIGGGRRITSRSLNPHRLWRTSVRRDSPLPLDQWLAKSVWLEEAAADVVRRLR